MRINGHIRIEAAAEDSVNEWGEIVIGSISYSDPIPALVNISTDNRHSVYDDGVSRQVSAEILIENPLKDEPKRIEVVRMGDSLGVKAVLSYQPLPTQGRIRILV